MDISKIKIAIDTGELQKAKDLLTQLEGQAKKTDKSVGGVSDRFIGLGSAIAGASLYQVTKQAIETADAMKLLDSRLKLTTSSNEEYLSQQTRLTQIAKGSYTSISDTVTLFTKLNPALKQVGASTEQVNSIVATFSKGLQLGGASVEESKSAILQFAQAMGSGVLRGDEFNSMAEASPKLMEYMARGLGVPQTELRKMAENGELTASRVGSALLKMKNDVEKDFATMPVTIGKAMTNLTTDTSLLIKEFDNLSGATSTISNWILALDKSIGSLSIEQISNMLDMMKNTAIAFGTSTIAITAYNGIMKAVRNSTAETLTITNLLKLSMNTIPFVAIVTGLTAIATSFSTASKEGDILNKTLQTQKDELKKLSDNQLNYREGLLEEEAIKARLAMNDAKARASKDNATAKDKSDQDEAIKYFEEITSKLRNIKSIREENAKNSANKTESNELKTLVTDYSKLSTELQKIVDPIRQVQEHYIDLRKKLTESGNATPMALSNLAKEEAEAIESVQKRMNKSAEELKKKQEEIAKAYSDLAKKGMTEYEQKLYDLKLEYIDFVKKTGDVAGGLKMLQDAETELNRRFDTQAIEKFNKEIDRQLGLLKDTYDLKEKQLNLIDDETERNKALTDLYYERRVQEIALERQKNEQSTEYYNGLLDYETKLHDKTLFRYSQTGQIIESVSSGMKSSMMDFLDYTSNGFRNLNKLAIDLGNMIYKAVTQQMVVNPLVSALGSAATSYFTPSTSVNMGSSASANASALGIGGTDSTFMNESIFKNAKGGTYSSQSLSNYSNGIYSTPQVFAFAKGGAPNIGVFGEAGAEAIMPLTRDSSGSLGVKAVGGNSNGVVKVEVINQSNQEVQVTNTSTRNDLEGTILSVWINAVNTNKMGVRNMIAGAR